MDRNTITGLVLIGLILTVFSIINQPSEKDIKKKQEKEVVVDNQKPLKKENTSNPKNNPAKTADKNVENSPKVDNIGKIIRLENEKLIVEFNTKGGIVAAVYLKDYKSYDDFSKNKDKPICLFRDGDAYNQLVFPLKDKKIYTKNEIFDISEQTKNKIVFEWEIDGGKIRQTYILKANKFDLDYVIQVEGLETVSKENILLNWKTAFRKTERLFSEQRRVSTICYNQKNEGFSYLSETADDNIELEDDLTWVAYKQSYFSSILKPKDYFNKKGSTLNIHTYEEGKERDSSHLKDYNSNLSLNFKNDKASFSWYFGPNDYETLKSYDKEYDQILNFGWGIFRWINLYAVQPIFSLLVNSKIGIGIAILILTLILKLILMPIQWKMFLSSVKMKILKPEVDELNAKYPKKEDAMKKQMEMMTL